MKKYKLAVLTSHPIQYQAPFFKEIAKNQEIDLMVYFCWDFGVDRPDYDSGFGKEIKWDIPLLEGYKYKFLKNYSTKPSSDFFGQINFGIIVEIFRGKFDAIIILGWNSFTNWFVFLVAFLTRTPIFIRGESPLNQESAKGFKKIIKNLILRFLFKITSAFLYIGEENKKFYQYYSVLEEKLFFVPYAVDNERYIEASSKLRNKKYELRKDLGINKNDMVILFTGKLIEKKRPFDLLMAFESLNSKFLSAGRYGSILNSSLIFVGDGILRGDLEKYVKERKIENVHFTGFKNQTELPKYYAMADIFVLPSGVGETWGLVVNEAMCFGLPIIISDIVGCGKDLVKNGKNGYIFSFGDIEKLSKYLGELASDNKKRKLFGKKSFEIIQNYSYEKDIDGILKALK